MNLTCPECSKEFQVTSDKIGDEGRKVRCGQCKHVWHATAPKFSDVLEDTNINDRLDEFRDQEKKSEKTIADKTNDVVTEKPQSKTETKKKTKTQSKLKKEKGELSQRRSIMLSVLIGIIVAMLLVLISFPFKSAIMNTWEPSKHIYALAGFDVNPEGHALVLERVKFANDETNKLSIQTAIINLGEKASAVPSLQVVLIDENKNALEGPGLIIETKISEIPPESAESFERTLDVQQELLNQTSEIKLQFVSSN